MPFYLLLIGIVVIGGGIFLFALIEQEMPSIKKGLAKMFQSRAELKKAKYELAKRKLEIEHEERMAAWKGIDDEPKPIAGAPPVSTKPKKSDDEEQVNA